MSVLALTRVRHQTHFLLEVTASTTSVAYEIVQWMSINQLVNTK